MTGRDWIRRLLAPLLMVFVVVPDLFCVFLRDTAREVWREFGHFAGRVADNWRDGWRTDAQWDAERQRIVEAMLGRGKVGKRQQPTKED